MLNCTDLACVLHHHHFYAHLHHLKHHLQDDHEHHAEHYHDTGTADDNGIDNIDGNVYNDQEQHSHLDAPNDVLYMVCGVVIAMLLVGLIIILVAVTISKLRKRESASPVDVEAPQVISASTDTTTTAATNTNNNNSSNTPIAFRQPPSTVWVFPPLPKQPNIYIYNASSQDALVQNDKNGLRGFKKQLSGRFKRLVTRKYQDNNAPTIPPELKPQLKQIYVY